MEGNGKILLSFMSEECVVIGDAVSKFFVLLIP